MHYTLYYIYFLLNEKFINEKLLKLEPHYTKKKKQLRKKTVMAAELNETVKAYVI